MSNPTVGSVMTPNPRTVRPDTEYKDIVDLLASSGISAVAVVDECGALVGVVSESDLLYKEERAGQADGARWFAGRAARERLRKASAVRARDLMSAPPRLIDADDELPAAAQALERSGLRRFFVVRDGKLVGVLARRDLLKVFLRSDEQIRSDVERVLGAVTGTVRVWVGNGTVTLLGRVACRGEVAIAGRLAAQIPGVVEVRNRLDYVWNDENVRRR